MSNITTTPTADLIAEWGTYNTQLADISQYGSNGNEWAEHCVSALAAELDRRCSEAGIKIENGCFLYSVIEYEYIEDDGDGNVSWGYGFVPQITAKEQHDLEAWLILKGGNG